MLMNWALMLVLVCVVLGVAGELLFKTGAMGLPEVNLSSVPGVISSVSSIFRSPVVLLGLLCYGIAAILWIFVLTRLDLSFAYPLYALMYAFIPLAAWFFLKEQIPAGRWAGILLIVAGLCVVLVVGQGH
jgi:drug/metabolite transporter (DMT)-like permease